MDQHTYETRLRWDGSTGVGYDAYRRAHVVTTAAPTVELNLSSDPHFGGDGSMVNPEQLLVAAAASCQLLSFLAVAARARLDVVAYRDQATAVMPTASEPVHITRIDLHPVVTLADTGRRRAPDDRLEHLTQVAHQECFIANSLTSEVVVTARFEWVPGGANGASQP